MVFFKLLLCKQYGMFSKIRLERYYLKIATNRIFLILEITYLIYLKVLVEKEELRGSCLVVEMLGNL